MTNQRAATFVALVLCCAVVQAGSFVSTSSDGLALEGYDAVAYFVDGKAEQGKAEFTALWAGAIWWFATAEHRDQFAAAPEKFAPEFGGYCAYAVAHNTDAAGDPKLWRVVGGKLYLNNNRLVQALWARDLPGSIEAGNSHWPEVRAKVEGRH